MSTQIRYMRADSRDWAEHVSACVERLLRKSDNPSERARLRELRDWHWSSLHSEELRR
jgi:hypothetical protein